MNSLPRARDRIIWTIWNPVLRSVRGARREHSGSYVTDEQRRNDPKMEPLSERALLACAIAKIFLHIFIYARKFSLRLGTKSPRQIVHIILSRALNFIRRHNQRQVRTASAAAQPCAQHEVSVGSESLGGRQGK